MPQDRPSWTQKIPRPFEDLAKEMEGLFERFLGGEPGAGATSPQPSGAAQPSGFAPPCNVCEADDRFEVTLDLPGVKPENVRVELQAEQLVVSGERPWRKEEGLAYHRIELAWGPFRRRLPLPGRIDEEKITAQFTDGVLRIVLPKSPAHQPRRIEIRTG